MHDGLAISPTLGNPHHIFTNPPSSPPHKSSLYLTWTMNNTFNLLNTLYLTPFFFQKNEVSPFYLICGSTTPIWVIGYPFVETNSREQWLLQCYCFSACKVWRVGKPWKKLSRWFWTRYKLYEMNIDYDGLPPIPLLWKVHFYSPSITIRGYYTPFRITLNHDLCFLCIYKINKN